MKTAKMAIDRNENLFWLTCPPESTGIVKQSGKEQKKKSHKEKLHVKQEIKRTFGIHQTHNSGNSLNNCENHYFCIFWLKALFKFVML